VAAKPALYQAAAPSVSSKLLPGDVAYVELPGFYYGAADEVLAAIANLAKGRTLRGVVLDLRGNGGGSPIEVSRLLGAFAHGKTTSYDCDVSGDCTANHTDDTVPLLGLPLTVLTDRDCASACDDFSSAVKDLRLGTLIGTRTSGVVAGSAGGYLLADGSLLIFPARHQVGANHEVINGIGVAPDYYLPRTAQDLSAGRDLDVAKALALLNS